MSARTFSTARKIHLGKDGILWQLEFDASLNMEQLGLQNWRIVGDGRTPKDQIRDYAKALHGLASREGEDTFLTVSGSSKNNLSSVGVRMTQKNSVCRQSQSAAHSPVKEAKETRAPSFARGASPSVVSEFSHAEGPREAKKVMIKDSYSFKIFRLENRERRDRASITELEFQREREGARPLTRTLIMECHTKENSSELFVLTIDAWTMMQDGAGSLGLYVRDTNRSWIKLWNPSKGYEASVHDALIVSRFLELAMTLTTSNPTMYINKLLSTSGSDEDEIKRILLKYYDSVVKKFLQLEVVPMSLRNAPTIKNMENFLRRTIEEDASTANASGIKRKHTWESDSNTGSDEVDQELLQKRAAVKSVLMKRKRVVESDSENDSDLEDYVPLSQRDFGFARRRPANAGDTESERRKKDLGALDNRLLSPCAAGRPTSAAGDKESERRKKDLGALDSRLLSPCAAGHPTSAAGDKESERTKKNLRALDNRLLSPSAAGRPTSAAGDKESERRKKNLGALDNSLLSPCAAGRPNSAAGDKESERRKKDLGALDKRLLSPCVAGRPTSTASTKGPSRSTRDNQGALGDSAVCAICDDGGELLFCDGECMRYFHASKRVAAQCESHCKSLGYTVEEVQEMGRWLCPNCVDKKHQCFVCGELGRSAGKDPQVFVCDVFLCGRFYHPECLVKWRTKEMQLTKVDKATIIAGLKNKKKDFCCPAHKCRRCGEGETEGGQDNMRKLAKCRRCPKAYHKSCLPRKISFEARDNEPIRAWEIVDENNSVKPIIIYCLDHDMDEALSTPKRHHLKWPNGHFYLLSRFSCN